jgi:hypothetical protein
MRANSVVMPPPRLDDRRCFNPISEPLQVQTFIAEFSVEAFVCAILPWFAWRNVRRFNACLREPTQNGA